MTNHTIQTSTSAIGHFVYHGTYETYLGEYLGGVPREWREEAEDKIGKLAVEIITDAFSDIFPNEFDVDEDFSLTYEGTYSPRYYNFETDSVNFTFKYSDELKNCMFDYVNGNDNFKKFLKDNYTSRDGFISFIPNNWEDWFDGWNMDEWKCVSALLRFLIEQRITESEMESYVYDFNERATTIISEQYTPWEYAEKFENGYVGVVYCEYDEEECVEIFNAYLLDTDGKIVNHVSMNDKWNNLNSSAYAAWDELEYDLTQGYALCAVNSEPCDVPEFNRAWGVNA